ncbi:MAG: universal stress protein [Caldimonas sp.]|nr:universal stress protein [Pseudomonadota bacterium]
MTLTTLLLPLDDDPLCELRTQFTLSLARAHASHVIGLACGGTVDLPVDAAGATSLSEYADVAWSAIRERNERCAGAFRIACASTPPVSFETISEESERAQAIVRRSHCADLVVLSQPNPSLPNDAAYRRMIEEVLLNGPRPTLLLPYAGHFKSSPRNVMVACNDSREGARALADALPLLRKSDQVQLVAWMEGDDDRSLLRSELDTVARWLGRHHVQATARVELLSGIGIADAMLSRAADLGAELIVMGAYGHARWSERILGGATRGILATMTVPVFMSH